MTPRRLSLLALLIAVVGVLALGSTTTATAGALTKGAVKKIAAKVIKKKASGLSVASAQTAANAQALAGQPASAYQDSVTLYSIAVPRQVSAIEYIIPTKVGLSYQVSFSATLERSAAGGVGCSFYLLNGNDVARQLGGSTVTAPAVADLSGILTVTPSPGQRVMMTCGSGQGIMTDPASPIQVTVAQLDSVVDAGTPPFYTEVGSPAQGSASKTH